MAISLLDKFVPTIPFWHIIVHILSHRLGILHQRVIQNKAFMCAHKRNGANNSGPVICSTGQCRVAWWNICNIATLQGLHVIRAIDSGHASWSRGQGRVTWCSIFTLHARTLRVETETKREWFYWLYGQTCPNKCVWVFKKYRNIC